LQLARLFPADDRGPLLLRALALLAAICCSLATGQAADSSLDACTSSGTFCSSIIRSESSRSCRPQPLRYSPIRRSAVSRRASNEASMRLSCSRSEDDLLIASPSMAYSSKPDSLSVFATRFLPCSLLNYASARVCARSSKSSGSSPPGVWKHSVRRCTNASRKAALMIAAFPRRRRRISQTMDRSRGHTSAR
jgi:hypothetical protein